MIEGACVVFVSRSATPLVRSAYHGRHHSPQITHSPVHRSPQSADHRSQPHLRVDLRLVGEHAREVVDGDLVAWCFVLNFEFESV